MRRWPRQIESVDDGHHLVHASSARMSVRGHQMRALDAGVGARRRVHGAGAATRAARKPKGVALSPLLLAVATAVVAVAGSAPNILFVPTPLNKFRLCSCHCFRHRFRLSSYCAVGAGSVR